MSFITAEAQRRREYSLIALQLSASAVKFLNQQYY